MRKSTSCSIFLAAAIAMIAVTGEAQVKDYRDIEYPELGEFEIPEPEIYELPNGLKVFLLEDHELPLIRVTARIRTGAVYEPAEKTGLAALTGSVLRTGGTRSMSGDELDEFLESRAASIEASIGNNVGTASMDSLKRDFDSVFEVFRDVLRYPAFAEDKLEVAKAQAKTGVARRNDNVGAITGREFSRLVYGADSPLSRMIEYATVDAIGQDDLVAWHGAYFHPNNIYLGVVGDFDSAEMKKKIADVLGGWPAGPEAMTPMVAFDDERTPGVFFIEKTDVTQANIRLGHLGIKVQDPDYFAVEVLNEILGGGFSSRLFQIVRKEKGLAYSVRGSIGSGYRHPGVAGFGLQTKSESMAAAVDAVFEVLRDFRGSGVTAEEMERAKSSILNSFVFNYASKGQVLAQQMLYAYFGLPGDFLESYRTNIEKVTAEDVLAAAQKHLHPDEMALLVVGKPDDFDRPVDSFGEVQVVDISIPEPVDPAAAAEATEETLAAGRAVLDRVAAAMGGGAAASMTAMRTEEEVVVSMQGQSMALSQEVVIVFPDKLYTVARLPMGEQVMVVNGQEGHMRMGPQSRPASPEQVQDRMRELGRDVHYVLRHLADGVEALAVGEDQVDGQACGVVTVRFHDASSNWCVDSSGQVLRKSYQGKHPLTGAPGQIEVLYSDFRDLDGRRIPHKSVMKVDGTELAVSTVTAFEIDPPVDPALFEKPAA